MKKTMPYLKRQQHTFGVLQKVGKMDLRHSVAELAQMQRQQQTLQRVLDKSQGELDQCAALSAQPGKVLVPELMASQSVYLHQLVQTRQQTDQQLKQLATQADEKRLLVFKLKKSNRLVQDKIDHTSTQMQRVYDQVMDETVADIRRSSTGKKENNR